MFCHYFILLLCVFAYCNQDGEWFNCKPKPGCSIARCDPRPAGQWFGNDGVSNEYPILCQQNEASSSVTADTEIVDQLQEIRIQLAKLEGRLEKSEKVEFEMNFDITLLERKNAKMKKEAEEGKRQLNGAVKQITSLEKTNREMRNEMDSMKKKAEEDKRKLNGAMKKITSLEKTNSEIRNEMDSMKKAAEEDKGKLNGAMKNITLLESKNAAMKKEAEEGKRQLNGAVKQISSIEKTNSEMRNEMDSMKKKAEEDKGKLNGAMKKITSLEKTNSEMRNEMDSIKKTAEEDKGKLNGAMKTTKELHDRIAILEKKVTQLNSTSSSVDQSAGGSGVLMERKVTELISTSTSGDQSAGDPEEIECEDGIIYRQKCYFALVHPTLDVQFTNAQDICERNHGRLADILDREHQRLITNYLRAKIPSSRSHIEIWLGMLYQISTTTLQWSNGTIVDAPLNWYSFPEYHSTYTHVGIIVNRATTATSNGLFNDSPTISVHGAVCEK